MSNFLARHKNEIKKVSCATLGELFGQKIALEVQFESTYIFQSWPVISVLYSQKFKVIYVFFCFVFSKFFLRGKNNIFLMWCWACTDFLSMSNKKGKKFQLLFRYSHRVCLESSFHVEFFFSIFFCIKNERGSVAVITFSGIVVIIL